MQCNHAGEPTVSAPETGNVRPSQNDIDAGTVRKLARMGCNQSEILEPADIGNIVTTVTTFTRRPILVPSIQSAYRPDRRTSATSPPSLLTRRRAPFVGTSQARCNLLVANQATVSHKYECTSGLMSTRPENCTNCCTAPASDPLAELVSILTREQRVRLLGMLFNPTQGGER
jgi:hypothetical protein